MTKGPVPEGIERADQLEKPLELGCELGQGFYFSKPLVIEGIEELLRARHILAARTQSSRPHVLSLPRPFA